MTLGFNSLWLMCVYALPAAWLIIGLLMGYALQKRWLSLLIVCLIALVGWGVDMILVYAQLLKVQHHIMLLLLWVLFATYACQMMHLLRPCPNRWLLPVICSIAGPGAYWLAFALGAGSIPHQTTMITSIIQAIVWMLYGFGLDNHHHHLARHAILIYRRRDAISI